jgi:hypothetical protein
MKFVAFTLVLIAASCPAVYAQPALWFCQEDLPRLRATVQQGPEAEVWQSLRERAENFCNPELGERRRDVLDRSRSLLSGHAQSGG